MEQRNTEFLDLAIRPHLLEAWKVCEKEMDKGDTLLYLIHTVISLAKSKGLHLDINTSKLQ
jgi:hypothetical protein